MFQALRVFRFPAIDRLWRFLVAMAIYSAGVYVFDLWVDPPTDKPKPTRLVEIVLSSLLFGWLMHFRANTAYDRWWEARKLWGQLVNVSRNIALKTCHLIRATPEDRERVAELLTSFAETLRTRLARPRGQPGDLEAARDPVAIAGRFYNLLEKWSREEANSWKVLAVDSEARQLMDVAGACERIRSTPLAASYRGLLRKGIGVYLAALPWMMIDETGPWTVLMTVIVCYVLVGLEVIADDIENPFTPGPDALNLTGVIEVIRETASAYARQPDGATEANPPPP